MAYPHPLAATIQTGSTFWIVAGWIALGVAFACALAILLDLVRGYRQHMAVMNAVWPITALYWGPVAIWLYFRRGRRMTGRWAREHGREMEDMMPSGGDDPPVGFFTAWPVNVWLIRRGCKEKM